MRTRVMPVLVLIVAFFTSHPTALHAQSFSNINAVLVPVAGGCGRWADYDNDGRLDILITGSWTNTMIYRNTGAGFSNINAGLPKLDEAIGRWGDYDNDDRLDFFLCGITTEHQWQSWIYRNATNGFTEVPVPWYSSSYVEDADWGDYNADGRIDLLRSGHLWMNTPAGFVHVFQFNHLLFASVLWFDYTGDHFLDIIYSGLYTGSDPAERQLCYWRYTGSNFTQTASLPGFTSGNLAWADFDNDGMSDILMTGSTSDLTYVSQIWRNTGGAFSNINAGLPPIVGGEAIPGDFDSDGRMDVLLSGSSITKLYRNTADGFVDTGQSFVPLGNSSVACGDYDNDGRLDFLVTGAQDPQGQVRRSIVYRNISSVTNSPPTAPSNLFASAVGNYVKLSWAPATDAQTPSLALTYNVRAGSTPGGIDIISPSSASNGFRRLPAHGNARQSLYTWLTGLTNGQIVYWSVQAVDQGYRGGPFSDEQSFAWPLPPGVKLTMTSAVCYATPAQTGKFYRLEGRDSPFTNLWYTMGTTLTNGANINFFEPGAGPVFYPARRIVTTDDTDGECLGFDGVDDYLLAPSATGLHLTSGFTIEAWVKPFTRSPGTILAKASSPSLVTYRLALDSNATPQLRLYDPSGSNFLNVTAAPLSTGVWTHLAATWDTQQANLFTNGILAATSAATGTLRISTISPIQAGGIYGADCLLGYLDELRLWDYARSEYDIFSTFDAKIPSSDPSLRLYWPITETNGQTIADATGNGFTGILGADEALEAVDPYFPVESFPGRTIYDEVFAFGTPSRAVTWSCRTGAWYQAQVQWYMPGQQWTNVGPQFQNHAGYVFVYDVSPGSQTFYRVIHSPDAASNPPFQAGLGISPDTTLATEPATK